MEDDFLAQISEETGISFQHVQADYEDYLSKIGGKHPKRMDVASVIDYVTRGVLPTPLKPPKAPLAKPNDEAVNLSDSEEEEDEHSVDEALMDMAKSQKKETEKAKKKEMISKIVMEDTPRIGSAFTADLEKTFDEEIKETAREVTNTAVTAALARAGVNPAITQKVFAKLQAEADSGELQRRLAPIVEQGMRQGMNAGVENLVIQTRQDLSTAQQRVPMIAAITGKAVKGIAPEILSNAPLQPIGNYSGGWNQNPYQQQQYVQQQQQYQSEYQHSGQYHQMQMQTPEQYVQQLAAYRQQLGQQLMINPTQELRYAYDQAYAREAEATRQLQLKRAQQQFSMQAPQMGYGQPSDIIFSQTDGSFSEGAGQFVGSTTEALAPVVTQLSAQATTAGIQAAGSAARTVKNDVAPAVNKALQEQVGPALKSGLSSLFSSASSAASSGAGAAKKKKQSYSERKKAEREVKVAGEYQPIGGTFNSSAVANYRANAGALLGKVQQTGKNAAATVTPGTGYRATATGQLDSYLSNPPKARNPAKDTLAMEKVTKAVGDAVTKEMTTEGGWADLLVNDFVLGKDGSGNLLEISNDAAKDYVSGAGKELTVRAIEGAPEFMDDAGQTTLNTGMIGVKVGRKATGLLLKLLANYEPSRQFGSFKWALHETFMHPEFDAAAIGGKKFDNGFMRFDGPNPDLAAAKSMYVDFGHLLPDHEYQAVAVDVLPIGKVLDILKETFHLGKGKDAEYDMRLHFARLCLGISKGWFPGIVGSGIDDLKLDVNSLKNYGKVVGDTIVTILQDEPPTAAIRMMDVISDYGIRLIRTVGGLRGSIELKNRQPLREDAEALLKGLSVLALESSKKGEASLKAAVERSKEIAAFREQASREDVRQQIETARKALETQMLDASINTPPPPVMLGDNYYNHVRGLLRVAENFDELMKPIGAKKDKVGFSKGTAVGAGRGATGTLVGTAGGAVGGTVLGVVAGAVVGGVITSALGPTYGHVIGIPVALAIAGAGTGVGTVAGGAAGGIVGGHAAIKAIKEGKIDPDKIREALLKDTRERKLPAVLIGCAQNTVLVAGAQISSTSDQLNDYINMLIYAIVGKAYTGLDQQENNALRALMSVMMFSLTQMFSTQHPGINKVMSSVVFKHLDMVGASNDAIEALANQIVTRPESDIAQIAKIVAEFPKHPHAGTVYFVTDKKNPSFMWGKNHLHPDAKHRVLFHAENSPVVHDASGHEYRMRNKMLMIDQKSPFSHHGTIAALKTVGEPYVDGKVTYKFAEIK